MSRTEFRIVVQNHMDRSPKGGVGKRLVGGDTVATEGHRRIDFFATSYCRSIRKKDYHSRGLW